jgi:hypothetical protein
MMKAASAALALALSGTVAMAQDSKQMTPEQARDYFKPGGKFEKDNPGIRQRAHDAEMQGRAQKEMQRRPPRIEDTEPRDDPRPGQS